MKIPWEKPWEKPWRSSPTWTRCRKVFRNLWKKDWNRLIGFKHRGWIFLRKGERAVKKESLFGQIVPMFTHPFCTTLSVTKLLENFNWLCNINSIDWTLLSFLGQVTCSWCLSSFELGPWQLKGPVMPTIFVIINGGNVKCEVNPLKAPWQIRSLFWALLEICRELNLKVSKASRDHASVHDAKSWVHFLCFY